MAAAWRIVERVESPVTPAPVVPWGRYDAKYRGAASCQAAPTTGAAAEVQYLASGSAKLHKLPQRNLMQVRVRRCMRSAY